MLYVTRISKCKIRSELLKFWNEKEGKQIFLSSLRKCSCFFAVITTAWSLHVLITCIYLAHNSAFLISFLSIQFLSSIPMFQRRKMLSRHNISSNSLDKTIFSVVLLHEINKFLAKTTEFKIQNLAQFSFFHIFANFEFYTLISNEVDVDKHEKCPKSTILEVRLLDKCSSLTETCGPQTCEKSE